MTLKNANLSPKTNDLSDYQARLAAAIERGADSQLNAAKLNLSLYRFKTQTKPTSYELAPSVCLIGRGTKRVFLSEEAYEYDYNSFLFCSMRLPLVAQIIEASEDKPYLGLTLELDSAEIARLSADKALPTIAARQTRRGIALGAVTTPLISAVTRLVELLDKPEDIPILSPLIQREILYRLFMSDCGAQLRAIGSSESQSYKIARAADWLKENFTRSFSVDKLATHSGMSVSNFYRHFHALTTMSPLQFQKKLRLNEARRLMLTENIDAASAAFLVG
ncbi:MAG: AraC family transcriptional regulator, partial [Helicobacteraceae bacterium]|nr:AraC family transcriptional regulator [Helicobacteraceae bacterium]